MWRATLPVAGYDLSTGLGSMDVSTLVANWGGSSLGATTTALVSSANPSAYGATVTFTATVTGAAPTGTVGFTDSGVPISGCGAVALTGSGNARTATCGTSGLVAGAHLIVASYGGDSLNAASQGSLTQTVQSHATTLVLSRTGQSVEPRRHGYFHGDGHWLRAHQHRRLYRWWRNDQWLRRGCADGVGQHP